MIEDPANNIELWSDEPKLNEIIEELDQAQSDANWFYRRMDQARSWWYSQWQGQTIDGRKHVQFQGADCFPWDGASDSRLRIVATLISDQVSVRKFSFFQSKIQARSVRPLQQAGESNKSTKLLQWTVYNHMWPQVLREVPLVFNWWQGYGVGFLGIEWEQQRRLEYHQISLQDLGQILGALGMGGGAGGTAASTGYPAPAVGAGVSPAGDIANQLLEILMDPTHEDDLTTLMQQLSPILSRPDARKIVTSLRTTGTASVPVAYPFINKPRWTALRPCVDVLFPSETSDLQEARWFCRMDDWVSETELTDRIETDGYDPAFVAELLNHKGEAGLASQPWSTQPWSSRDSSSRDNGAPRSYRNLMQLYHFYYKALDNGTPCMYKTVFNPLVKGKDGKPLCAKHGMAEYNHGQYPAIEFCRRTEDRRILGSMGICEESYTDELDVKRQQDGLSDRTSLCHRPPMIVPYSRVKDIKGTPIPGAVLGVSRPREVDWMPMPPTDGTPIQVIEMVQQRIDRRYGLFGVNVDPELKQMRRQEAGQDTLALMGLVLEQTWQLMQQYEAPEEVAEVIGQLARPFPVSREEIQGKHEISATTDMRMMDADYAQEKMALIGQALAFKQEGMLFNMAVEAIDPDAADALEQNQVSPEAQQKEQSDELNAIAQAFAGVEAPLPMYANNQLRLQTLMANTIQSPNPMMAQRLQMLPDTQKILQNRAQFFQNQIQQFTQNPVIGRALQTSTFQPKQAPQLMAPPGGTQGGQ
jgi:hypothetical protein